jgi:hypothetical protein
MPCGQWLNVSKVHIQGLPQSLTLFSLLPPSISYRKSQETRLGCESGELGSLHFWGIQFLFSYFSIGRQHTVSILEIERCVLDRSYTLERYLACEEHHRSTLGPSSAWTGVGRRYRKTSILDWWGVGGGTGEMGTSSVFLPEMLLWYNAKKGSKKNTSLGVIPRLL